MVPFTFNYVSKIMHCVHVFVAVTSQPESLELLVVSVSVDEYDTDNRDDYEQQKTDSDDQTYIVCK